MEENINPVGIMQGRLSKPINGMIQAFPKDTWREEFQIASEIGFDCMEIIFDGPNNPLFTSEGALEIKKISDDAKIKISSISNDFSMFFPLFGDTKKYSLETILTLIQQCSSIGVPRVGISFEDNSSILNEKHRDEAINNMKEILIVAEELNIIITIETFLFGYNLELFIDSIASPNLKVNFDTGNSCAYGEDSEKVIQSLGNLIGGIHIKDRKRMFGTTYALGTGDTDLAGCFRAIRKIGYKDSIIIQGARGNNDIQTAINYRKLILNFLKS